MFANIDCRSKATRGSVEEFSILRKPLDSQSNSQSQLLLLGDNMKRKSSALAIAKSIKLVYKRSSEFL